MRTPEQNEKLVRICELSREILAEVKATRPGKLPAYPEQALHEAAGHLYEAGIVSCDMAMFVAKKKRMVESLGM